MGGAGSGVRRGSASSIEISFQYQGERCRERIPLQPTAANLKKAALHKAAIDHAIMIGQFDYAATFPNSPNAARFRVPVDQTPLERFLPDWLERHQRSVKSSTFNGYRKMVNGPLMRMFGKLSLGELTREVIAEQLGALTVSNKRLINLQSCLRTALDDAHMRKLLTTNPLTGWSFSVRDPLKGDPEVAGEADDIDPFDADEQAAILAPMQPQIRNLYQFAFWSGLRTSELVALEWRDIDWVNKRVMIKRALTQDAETAESPKTQAGRRMVKLLGPALHALIAQKPHTFMLNRQVFHDPRYDRPFNGDQALRKSFWMPALRKAGVRYRWPYQTRHTYASMMLSAGEHPMWVASQMGHKDWTMIAKRYGRWMPSADTEAGSRAEAIFAMREVCQNDHDNIRTTAPLKAPK